MKVISDDEFSVKKPCYSELDFSSKNATYIVARVILFFITDYQRLVCSARH